MQTLKTGTRKRILNVSKRLFLKKGFRETTTRDIASEAGINLSNMYHYFASKDELFQVLLKPATDTLESMLNEHHGIKGEDNALAEGVAERTSFARGDAQKLDYPDGTFDAVTSNYVYHNIPSRDRQAILLETLRVLKKGGSFAIHDLFSKDKYGDMQAFVKKLKDLGYEQVEFIPTDNGRFMSPWEARWMGLSGSALLVGKKL